MEATKLLVTHSLWVAWYGCFSSGLVVSELVGEINSKNTIVLLIILAAVIVYLGILFGFTFWRHFQLLKINSNKDKISHMQVTMTPVFLSVRDQLSEK